MSIMPFGMRGNGEFERKFEEIILNEVRMEGRATIKVTLNVANLTHWLLSQKRDGVDGWMDTH